MSIFYPTLSEWLDHFERLHPVGIDMGLSRVAEVWQRLCNIHHISRLAKEHVISVSGTNGKGSVCQMLSLLLRGENVRVGTYTSPHIHHFRERVQINGVSVDDKLLIDAFAAIETAREEISLSYFEATTLVGLLVFAWEDVDYAVLEVGLGGRLDAINIIDADAAILTSVGLDHVAFLGDDIEQIAVEKAGIFRPEKPAVYAQPHVYQSVLDDAENRRIPLLINGRDYTQTHLALEFQGKNYQLPQTLLDWGEHQLQNAAAVVVLLATLKRLPDDYRQRLADFSLAGRLQVIRQSPTVIIDVAHNTAAAKALAATIAQRNHDGNIFAVIGMLKDKDHAEVLSQFNGLFDHVYFGSTWGERGYSSQDLQQVYQSLNQNNSSAYPTLLEALEAAESDADDKTVIYAFGSFLVVEALTENQ